MKTTYLGIRLILSTDACGLLEYVQVPDSDQNIMSVLSCDCLKHCAKVANDDYMGNNKEAYE